MKRFTDYGSQFGISTLDKDYVLPEKISRIEISYDGGRFSVTINDTEVFSDRCCSHDVSLILDDKNE